MRILTHTVASYKCHAESILELQRIILLPSKCMAIYHRLYAYTHQKSPPTAVLISFVTENDLLVVSGTL